MSADQEEVFRRYTEVIGHPVARPDEPQNLQQPDIRQPIVATTSYGSIAGAVVAVPSYAIQPKP